MTTGSMKIKLEQAKSPDRGRQVHGQTTNHQKVSQEFLA